MGEEWALPGKGVLLGSISRTHEWLLSGECIPFHQYWQHCLGPFVEEIGAALRAGQVIIWVDGQPVLDPSGQLPVTRRSQFALSRGQRKITEVLPHGAWWN